MSQLGKRYICEICGQTVICVTAGDGDFSCHGQDMVAVQPKQVPSSD